jgi:hypothetical protein
MKVTRGPPLLIHDVAGESTVYCLHHEGAQFIAKRLHDMSVKFRVCIVVHIHDRSRNSNGFSIIHLQGL